MPTKLPARKPAPKKLTPKQQIAKFMAPKSKPVPKAKAQTYGQGPYVLDTPMSMPKGFKGPSGKPPGAK